MKIKLNYKIYASIIVILIILVSVYAFRQINRGGQGSNVILTINKNSDSKDYDKDGSPDWLEVLLDSDPRDKTSFPYNNKIQKRIETIKSFEYLGPGEEALDVFRKLNNLNGAQGEITKEERETFLEDSSGYFLSRIEKRGEPKVEIAVSDELDRNEVLKNYVEGLLIFSDERLVKQPIETTVLDLVSGNLEAIKYVEGSRVACSRALSKLPKEVPKEAFNNYRIVYKQIVFLCEALNLSTEKTSAENSLYILNLLISGLDPSFIDAENQEEYLNNLLLQVETDIIGKTLNL